MTDEKPPMVSHWMGERIDTMPREKLLEIIDYLARQLSSYQTPAMSRAIGLGRAQMLIRGEPTSQ